MNRPLKIDKSSRHQKIIGCFGEHAICNWLSRSGFEVTIVDHTGIDIIAYDPKSDRRFGITVKSRTRKRRTETQDVTLFRYHRRRDDREKLQKACEAFKCEPWIGVYVETQDAADLFLTSLENYEEKYRRGAGKSTDSWKMTDKAKRSYDEDPNVMHVRMKFETIQWWDQTSQT